MWKIVLLVLTLAVAACQPPATTMGDSPVGAAGGQPQATTASANPATQTPVIVYSRSGGIAGIRQRYEIYADGRIVVDDKGRVSERRADAEQVQATLDKLETLGFFSLPAGLPGPGTGADRITSELSITRDGKAYTVTMIDGEAGMPAGLAESFALVSALIDSAGQ